MSDNGLELVIAVVALVISVLAFVIAILQALQQYFASATGFSSCSEEVIGKWSAFARRQMRWSEFRFEVQFEVPVIFVASPGNKRGPLGADEDQNDEDRKIIRLDGTESNFRYTSSMQEFDEQYKRSKQQTIHTADNERATWYALLMAVCRMEKESRLWQEKMSSQSQTTNGPPPDSKDSPSVSSAGHVRPAEKHSLLVCMQRKRRTWDSMPEGLGKPYATTTISHLVEMAAMLGIHWRQFDLNNDRYRAQGNGFVLYGSYVDNLGITFSFQKQGPTWFERDRVIPNYDVKKLCFGIAPTIFARDKKNVFADEPKDLGSLQLGSLTEIATTLGMLGCDIHTVNLFRKNTEQARHSHLFPVPFEILGMVGKMLHISDTVFRMLPNPTVFYWDPTSFSLSTLMAEFMVSLRTLQQDKSTDHSNQIDGMLKWADDTRILLPRTSTTMLYENGETVNGAQLINELNHLRAGIESSDAFLKDKGVSIVRKVVCVHTQEVLNFLNKRENDGGNEDGPKTTGAEQERGNGDPTIYDIDSAFSDDKESLLIETYFRCIRENVVRIVHKNDVDKKQRRARRSAEEVGEDAAANPQGTETVPPGQITEIWCTLVFRMLCWLQLHDFHKLDIQVSKSDTFASRIPVYIV